MELCPTPLERIARARSDLRMGLPVAVRTTAGVVLIAAIETLSSARLGALRELGAGVVGITARRAETLKARAYDGDLARLGLPSDVGLSWLRAVADPGEDLNHPMKGPLRALREGEAAPWRIGIALAKGARLLPAVLGVAVAQMPEGLTWIDQSDLGAEADARLLDETIWAALPMLAHPEGRLHIYRPRDGMEEHYAVEIGAVDRHAPVLVRLHSACFTGDVLGSLKCDCGPQLRAAMAQMGQEGGGVLLYLNQEGRGIGLANKMRAYSLQDQGFDTVEANHRLGFEDDERDFRLGAAILAKLGIGAVRLLTNNPAKIRMMQSQGIAVAERVPLRVGQTPENKDYLATKAQKSGHLL